MGEFSREAGAHHPRFVDRAPRQHEDTQGSYDSLVLKLSNLHRPTTVQDFPNTSLKRPSGPLIEVNLGLLEEGSSGESSSYDP